MAAFPYLQLMRPANIVTSLADVLLGAAAAYALANIAGQTILFPWQAELWWLLASTAGLYGGGVVMNDVFDAGLDRVERPERPIPSGKVSEKQASVFGILLLTAGVAAAAQAGGRSACLAFAIAALAVLYDAFAKHHDWFGPLAMGSCRGANLLLGMSILPLTTAGTGLAILPIFYIAAITLISRGEVDGGNRKSLYFAMLAYGIVVAAMLGLLFYFGQPILPGLAIIVLFGGMVFPALFRAIGDPSGPKVGKAVKAGVIALIAFDAALAASLAGWPSGLLILALLPVSWLLASFFAVT